MFSHHLTRLLFLAASFSVLIPERPTWNDGDFFAIRFAR
jgi:hypothetical protein